jgi:hypothetical protein
VRLSKIGCSLTTERQTLPATRPAAGDLYRLSRTFFPRRNPGTRGLIALIAHIFQKKSGRFGPACRGAYMGRKRILPMLSLHGQELVILAPVFSPHSKSVRTGSMLRTKPEISARLAPLRNCVIGLVGKSCIERRIKPRGIRSSLEFKVVLQRVDRVGVVSGNRGSVSLVAGLHFHRYPAFGLIDVTIVKTDRVGRIRNAGYDQ